jgi:hypothetical protein
VEIFFLFGNAVSHNYLVLLDFSVFSVRFFLDNRNLLFYCYAFKYVSAGKQNDDTTSNLLEPPIRIGLWLGVGNHRSEIVWFALEDAV